MLNLLHGDYVFMDELVAAHRNHDSGVWSSQSDHEQILSTIRTWKMFLEHLPEPTRSGVRKRAVMGAWHRGSSFLKKGQAETALRLFEFCAEHRDDDYPPKLGLWRRKRRARRMAAAAQRSE